jgi:hypothetical protein
MFNKMAKILCAAFLLGLKADNDARVKANTIKAIGENLQGQVVAYATQGKRFIQADASNALFGSDYDKFLDENMPEVFTALTTHYFDKSVKIEVKKMLKNPMARGDEPLWVDINSLPPVHHLRSGWQKATHIFEISW